MTILTNNTQDNLASAEPIPSNNQVITHQNPKPSPEVRPSQLRRHFTARYKLNLLDELDRCTKPGEKGAILRREGLYSSHVSDWRKQRNEGILSALNKTRGRKKIKDTKDEKISELEQKIIDLENKLEQAETIIDVQKKVSEIFGITNRKPKNNDDKS